MVSGLASNTSGREFISFHWFLSVMIYLLADTGLCTARAAMTVKLTENSKEVNTAKLGIIEKDGSSKRLSEQLDNKSL